METLRYCKVRKVKSPARAHAADAGVDFYIPEDIDVDTFATKCDVTKCYPNYTLTDDYFIKDITLVPGQSILIPSGIHVDVPVGYALIFMNKSGVASKKHLHVGAAVVDSGYEGECHINLTNVGDCNMTISAGDKIVQGVVVPVECCNMTEMQSLDQLYVNKSERSTGGFGSTGVN